MSGAGEREGERERERKKGITGGMEEREGGLDIPIKGGAKVGGRGDRALLGKIQAFPSKLEFAWEKKRGGRKGGRAERRVGMEDGQSLGKRENR